MIEKGVCLLCMLCLCFSTPDDFKPQSVDSTKPGQLKVTDDEVNVSLPVVGQVHQILYMSISRWYHVTRRVALDYNIS